MPEFVDLMESMPIKIGADHPKMEVYWESNEWVLEPIYKGRRYQCSIEDDIQFSTTRQESNPRPINEKVLHIIEELKAFPKQSLLDGYITKGNNYEETLRVLESDTEKALELQKSCQLCFVITDAIFLNGEHCFDFPLFDRKEKLSGFKNSEHVQIVDSYYDSKYNEYEKQKDLYDAFYFKDLDSSYIFGRSSRWKMFKEAKTYYAVILDVLEGKGKHENMCGSLEIGQYKNNEMTRITNIGGITMDDRALFFQEKQKFLNKVVEIKALKKTDDNYAEARFYRLREDKKPEDCIF